MQTLQDGSNDEKLANNTLHIGKANSVRYAYYVVCFSRKAHKRIKRKKLSFRGFGRIKDNPQSLVETLEQASPSYPAALHEESREVAIFETILVAQGRFGRRRKVEA